LFYVIEAQKVAGDMYTTSLKFRLGENEGEPLSRKQLDEMMLA
jgi:hypothetical protein